MHANGLPPPQPSQEHIRHWKRLIRSRWVVSEATPRGAIALKLSKQPPQTTKSPISSAHMALEFGSQCLNAWDIRSLTAALNRQNTKSARRSCSPTVDHSTKRVKNCINSRFYRPIPQVEATLTVDGPCTRPVKILVGVT